MNRIALLAAVWLFLPSGGALLGDEGDRDLLSELREKDAPLTEIDLESIRLLPIEHTESFPRRDMVKYTRKDTLYAIEAEFLEVLTDEPAFPQSDFGGESTGYPAVPLIHSYIFDGEKSAIRQAVALEHTEDWSPVKSGGTQIYQHVFLPEDDSLTMFAFMPKWVLGRGFSEHLTDLKVESGGEGALLRATGSGFFVPRMTGTWHLILDPEQELLVREAQFIRDEKVQPMLRVRTSGILAAESAGDESVRLAAAGSYTQFHGSEESSIDFQHLRVSLRTNQDFFNVVRDKFGEELPVRSMLVDSRGSEDVARVIAPEPKDSPAPVERQNQLIWTVFLINLGLLGVALFIWYLRNRTAK